MPRPLILSAPLLPINFFFLIGHPVPLEKAPYRAHAALHVVLSPSLKSK
jgi:hypothetical protein